MIRCSIKLSLNLIFFVKYYDWRLNLRLYLRIYIKFGNYISMFSLMFLFPIIVIGLCLRLRVEVRY